MSAYLWIIISSVLLAVAVGSILSVVMCINGGQEIKYDLFKDTEDNDEEDAKEGGKANDQ